MKRLICLAIILVSGCSLLSSDAMYLSSETMERNAQSECFFIYGMCPGPLPP